MRPMQIVRWIVGLAAGCALIGPGNAQVVVKKPAGPTDFVAGRSFGRVKIGMTKIEVIKMLGAPVSEAPLESEVTEALWLGSVHKGKAIRKREFVSVYFYHDSVVQIDGSSPGFKSKEGLSTTSTWAEMVMAYPVTTFRKRAYPLDPDQPKLLHFAADDAEQGIGWYQAQFEAVGVKAKPTQSIDAIVIHRPGTRLFFGVAHQEVWKEPDHTTKPAEKPKTDKGKGGKKPKGQTKPKATGPIKVGETAPEITGVTISGDDYSLKESIKNGKGALITFWYSTNAACRAQMPKLQELSDKFAEKGLIVLGVDLGEKREAVKSFLKAKGIKFPVIVDADGDGPVALYQVLSFPTNVIVGTDGKIVEIIQGFDEAEIRKALEKAGFPGV